MPEEDKVKEYIKKRLERGHNLEQIREALVNAGWHPEKIDAHIKELSSKISKKLKIPIGLIIVLALIFIVSFLYYSNLKNKTSSKAVEFDINQQVNLYVNKGNSLCSEGKFLEAQAEFDKAIQYNQTKSKVYYSKGACYTLEKKYNDAVSQLTKAIQLNPTRPDYYFYLGANYCELGNYEVGIKNLNKSIEINGTRQRYYQTLGRCYLQMGDVNNAIFWFNKSASLQFS